jgi:hypothetical protein
MHSMNWFSFRRRRHVVVSNIPVGTEALGSARSTQPIPMTIKRRHFATKLRKNWRVISVGCLIAIGGPVVVHLAGGGWGGVVTNGVLGIIVLLLGVSSTDLDFVTRG